MKKLFIPLATLFALAVFFVSCATDEPEIGGKLIPDPVSEVDPLAIPLDNALDEMYGLMDALYDPATRASRPGIASIETLKGEHFGGLTRAGEPFPENLYYIVNFENDGGFALLGADQSSEPVLCITEAGSLTLSDFLKSGVATRAMGGYTIDDLWTPYSEMEGYEYDPADDPDPDGGEYLTGAMAPHQDYVTGLLQNGIDGTEDLNHFGAGQGSPTSYGEWMNGTLVRPFLTTHWHQHAPFNDECPFRTFYSGRASAGCVPVAVAQILAWNEKPARPSQVAPGIASTWAELRGYDPNTYDAETKTPAQTRIERDMALLVHQIGLSTRTTYDLLFFAEGQSFTLPINAKRYMKWDIGYSNAKRRVGYQEDKIRSMVVDKRRPVFLAGISGTVGGHAWVVDGYMEQTRTKTTFTNGVVTSTGTETRKLFHCNFGWYGGRCNGYYVSKIFNLNNGPEETDAIDTFETDFPNENNSSDSNFTWWFRIIEY